MKLTSQVKLFLGMRIDSKLREALAQATPGDRKYFDDPNSPFLRVVNMGEDQWIGKLFDGGTSPTEIEDISRNVSSILNRIAHGGRHSPSLMRIFAVEEGQEAAVKAGGPEVIEPTYR